MSKKVKFLQSFGKYRAGDTKKVTDTDAFRLGRLGLTEVVTAEGDTLQTRMLTSSDRRSRPRGKPKAAKNQNPADES